MPIGLISCREYSIGLILEMTENTNTFFNTFGVGWPRGQSAQRTIADAKHWLVVG
jgi:hypothetical protein